MARAMPPRRLVCLVLAGMLTAGLAAQPPGEPSRVLPAPAAAALAKGLESARAYKSHPWRDTPPLNDDGTVNAYVEIPRGERRKWEFDIAANARAIDRVMPGEVGGYPVNYGFVPQTVSYDGDPFDVLVLGPPLPGGTIVSGTIAGLLLMEDDKGPDAKVVVSPVAGGGVPQFVLDERVRAAIGDYFSRYLQHEPGRFSRVQGWGSAANGRAFVSVTHAFFEHCRLAQERACRLPE